MLSQICEDRVIISIHALREEGDQSSAKKPANSLNFYPRPPRGGRRDNKAKKDTAANFYPRPPRGGRPAWMEQGDAEMKNFYPRPPRGGRRPYIGSNFGSY